MSRDTDPAPPPSARDISETLQRHQTQLEHLGASVGILLDSAQRRDEHDRRQADIVAGIYEIVTRMASELLAEREHIRSLPCQDGHGCMVRRGLVELKPQPVPAP